LQTAMNLMLVAVQLLASSVLLWGIASSVGSRLAALSDRTRATVAFVLSLALIATALLPIYAVAGASASMSAIVLQLVLIAFATIG
jgi:hypothetical protein